MHSQRFRVIYRVVIAAFVVALLTGTHPPDGDYEASTEQWRTQRRASLLTEDGYLAVAGLYWLEEGASTFGSDPANDFVLPPGSAPAKVGVFEHRDGTTRAIASSGTSFLSRNRRQSSCSTSWAISRTTGHLAMW